MKKRSRPKLQGIIEPPTHNHITKQSHDSVNPGLLDGDVPTADATTEADASAPYPASDTGRTKGRNTGGELKDYAHRSLYARPETLELIRELAFKERKSAQALYREGLFLMLRERGCFQDKTVDDI